MEDKKTSSPNFLKRLRSMELNISSQAHIKSTDDAESSESHLYSHARIHLDS